MLPSVFGESHLEVRWRASDVEDSRGDVSNRLLAMELCLRTRFRNKRRAFVTCHVHEKSPHRDVRSDIERMRVLSLVVTSLPDRMMLSEPPAQRELVRFEPLQTLLVFR